MGTAAGVSVFEHTRVKAIEPGSRWRVHAEESEIVAHDVFVATNIPVADSQGYDVRVQPRCHLAMAFHIDPASAPNGMFIAAEEPFHSIRTGHDGAGLVLVVLGPRFNTGQQGDVVGKFREFEDWVRGNFSIRDVGWRWANEDMDTADRLAFVGAAQRDFGLYVATGFNAWGLTNGTATGILVADQILGRANPWTSLFDPGDPTRKTSTPVDRPPLLSVPSPKLAPAKVASSSMKARKSRFGKTSGV